MYITRDLYQKYASFIDMDSYDFFVKSCAKAYKTFKTGRKIKKKESPVVFASTVKDFNEKEDQTIARVEMLSLIHI